MTRKVELEQIIEFHNKKYWKENNPVISDTEYDKYIEELKILDANSKLVSQVFNPSVNKQQMLSLQKVYSVDALKKWINSVKRNDNERFLFEPKLDGISGNFQNCHLLTKEEDISRKIHLIQYVDKNGIHSLQDMKKDARGEIIIPKDIYTKHRKIFKRDNGELFKTARHACGGILMKKTINNIFIKKIHFVDFEAFAKEYSITELLNLNFKNIEQQIRNIKYFNYDVDGFVIKLADTKYSESLGNTSHHPRGQMSYKFQSESKETVLLDIVLKVGKYNMTPVGLIKPIELYNTKINRVNLHNAKFLLTKDIRINDYVTIEKAGEIIPHLIKSRPGENRRKPIFQFCPNCGNKLSYKEPHIFCDNPDCEGTYLKQLYDAIVRLGIQTLGFTTLEKLNSHGFDNIIKILNVRKSDLLNLERFGERSAINLFEEIQKIKKNPIEDWKILASLNIRGIGRSLSQKLLQTITLNSLIVLKPLDLEKIENIGPKRSEEIYYDLRNKRNILIKLYNTFPSIIVTQENKQKTTYICMTGKGNLPRNKLKELCLKKGFYAKNSVSKDVQLVVAEDINGESRKIQQGKRLGIKIISYEEFEKELVS